MRRDGGVPCPDCGGIVYGHPCFTTDAEVLANHKRLACASSSRAKGEK